MTSQELTRRNFLKTAFMAAGACALPISRLPGQTPAAKRPNILFILADDMGWMDCELYGSEYYDMPNITRLARRGMMFTNAYSASPLCSPTRASILTGKYPERLHLTTPACHLPPEPFLPEIAQQAAPHQKVVTPHSIRYLPLEEFTVGQAFQEAGYTTALMGKWHLGHSEEHWAKHQGFEVDLGAPVPGPPSYFAPYRMRNFPNGPKGEYVTDRLTQEAVDFLEQQGGSPFMLFLWHFAVHSPFQAPQEMVDKWRKRTDPRGKQESPVMAAMLKSMDDGIGRVLDTLDRLNLTENTIIVFFSDNGGNMYDEIEGVPPTHNSPLRGGKGNGYEGGTRVPLIVSWPGVVEPASKSEAIVSSIDMYPTFLEMAGIKNTRQSPLDGVSFAPALRQEAFDRGAIFCHFPHYGPATQNIPCTWVRQGDWKLIRFYGEAPDRGHGYELYNLREDIGEQNNLAAQMPEKVAVMDRLIESHLKNTGAMVPIKNPRYTAPKSGWQASGNVQSEQRDGLLKLNVSESQAVLDCEDLPIVRNAMALRFRMRSELPGPITVYFKDDRNNEFAKSRSITIDAVQKGQWHDYQANFSPNGRLTGLRLIPGSGRGIVEFESIQLMRKYGETLRLWRF